MPSDRVDNMVWAYSNYCPPYRMLSKFNMSHYSLWWDHGEVLFHFGNEAEQVEQHHDARYHLSDQGHLLYVLYPDLWRAYITRFHHKILSETWFRKIVYYFTGLPPLILAICSSLKYYTQDDGSVSPDRTCTGVPSGECPLSFNRSTRRLGGIPAHLISANHMLKL